MDLIYAPHSKPNKDPVKYFLFHCVSKAWYRIQSSIMPSGVIWAFEAYNWLLTSLMVPILVPSHKYLCIQVEGYFLELF